MPFEDLPRTAMWTLKGRLLLAGAAILVACVVTMAIGVALQSAALTFGMFGALFSLWASWIVTGLVLNVRAARAVEEMRRTPDRQTRVAVAIRAIRIGVKSDAWIEAWLVLARFHEKLHGLAHAEEALVRAKRPPSGRARPPSPFLLAVVDARLAFLLAARGELDEAECILGRLPVAATDPAFRPEYARAASMVAYKRGRFREVVDLAASSIAADERDRELLAALEQSSLLRLASGSPERVAEAPHEEWMERFVPELRRRS